MTVHLLRKAFHAETLEDLAAWQDRRRKESKAQGRGNKVRTFLRNAPTRGEELLDGGSIYWIVKNQIRARQRVLAIERVTDPEARRRCALVLDREIVATVPYPVRARRGWRYLEANAVPEDLPKAAKGSTALPADLAAELRELGLL
jgi:hypothetical protein